MERCPPRSRAAGKGISKGDLDKTWGEVEKKSRGLASTELVPSSPRVLLRHPDGVAEAERGEMFVVETVLERKNGSHYE